MEVYIESEEGIMERFGMSATPIGREQTVVKGKVRLSVLSQRILRIEYNEQEVFEERPSQKIFKRHFGDPQYYTVSQEENTCTITTGSATFEVNVETLAVRVHLASAKEGTWVDSQAVTPLGGTFRTLDNAYGSKIMHGQFKGKIELKDSVFSEEGVAEIDDSKSLLLNTDGTLGRREEGAVDRYVLAFGKDFLGGLKEFYQLTGPTPLLPKYALGNWWSRYYAYRQNEYVALMDKFRAKKIPFTVATIDMDWHIVKNAPEDAGTTMKWGGPGWTGYTFEKELFPDYKEFFKDLKKRGLAITMNLHPHDGIRYFEEQYVKMARANDIDPDTKKPVPFDFTNRKFVTSYFDLVLHPYEDDGVDFWWIDWQQGTTSKVEGLDPLWLLNHYHTLDAGRDGRTPLILSRYCGTGAHRYPLGFSGDTIVSWKSLAYQPYFTAAASNVGYTWWSHDIGGHMLSRGKAELYVRWLQYGVFSPINRLHSTRDKWSKEPWLYGEEAEKIATDFLRLRHQLLPYLYTANVRTAKEGVPLVMPMYYLDDCPQAYEYKDQYYFGENVIVAPVLEKRKRDKMARVKCWLPKGRWTDFFTGEVFEGGKEYTVLCPLERIPVFVREGAIIPMLPADKGNKQDFIELEVRVYGGNGKYRMSDEVGYIEFTTMRREETVDVRIEPGKGCVTQEIELHFVGCKPGKVECKGIAVTIS